VKLDKDEEIAQKMQSNNVNDHMLQKIKEIVNYQYEFTSEISGVKMYK